MSPHLCVIESPRSYQTCQQYGHTEEEDEDAYIIPEIVHILTRNSTPEAKIVMSSLSTSASEDEKVDRGVWSEAIIPKDSATFTTGKRSA